MKTSDHFIGVPAASLPGTSVFAIPGAGFQVLSGNSVSKSNHLSRPTLIFPSCSEKMAIWGAAERPELSRLTWSCDRGAVHCEVGCTQFWKTKNWGLLLIFLKIVLHRSASARLFFSSSPCKTQRETGGQLSADERLLALCQCSGELRCCVWVVWHGVAFLWRPLTFLGVWSPVHYNGGAAGSCKVQVFWPPVAGWRCQARCSQLRYGHY